MPEWERVALGDVLELKIDAVPINTEDTYNISGVYSFGRGLIARGPLSGADTSYKVFHRLRKDDFVLSQLKAWEGALARVTAEFDGWFLSPQFPTFRVKPGQLDIEYLELFCKQTSVWDALRNQSRGMGARRDSVSPARFLALEIPLPPLPEQRRIVARVKGLLEKVDEARGLREAASFQSKALVAARRNEIFQELSQRIPPQRLDEVASVQLGKMLSEKSKTGIGTTPYLRNANVKWNSFDLSSIYTMDFDEREKAKFNLQYGDILMCEGGDIGQSAMWREELSGCCYQKALHRIRRIKEDLEPDFLLQHLFWAAETGQFHEAKTQTTIAHLPAVKLKAQIVFVPSAREQKRIVKTLQSEQNKLSALAEHQAVSSTELNALPASILARAFAGAL